MADFTSYIIILLILFLLWLPQAVNQVMSWTYWWQVKEYRIDRFRIFLGSSDGRTSLGIKNIFLKFSIIFIANYYLPLLIILLLYLDFVLIRDFFNKKIRRPIITERIKKIWLTSLLGLVLTFYLLYFLFINALLVGEIFLILTPLIGILWTIPLVKKAKKHEIEKAITILKKYKPAVIGITGSYGKTTTKDFIFQLLSSKFNVLSTYKNQNTHFGILRRINNDLTGEHEYFIAEIGAYKMGEIREIAEILKPKLAFITGIEPQHVELFGSLGNLKKAKFELIEALDNWGVAFFNLTDERVSDLVVSTEKLKKNIKIYTYALNKKGKFDASSVIRKITSDGVDFSISIKGETKMVKTNIYAYPLIVNLTGAILLARNLGVEWEKIIKVCRKLSLPEGTLNMFNTKGGIVVIDDSYNSSPSGFDAALSVLAQTRGNKKFIVTSGIIEMGPVAYKVHKKLAKKINNLADKVILRNSDFEKPFKDGLTDTNKLVLIREPKKMISYLKENVNRNDVVLVEGKLPQVTNYLRSI